MTVVKVVSRENALMVRAINGLMVRNLWQNQAQGKHPRGLTGQENTYVMETREVVVDVFVGPC